MTCSFCGSRNASGETRCRRCGRRPEDTLTPERALWTQGNLATAPRFEAVETPTASCTRPMSARPVQHRLAFDEQSNVVEFATFAAPRAESRRKGPSKPRGTKKPESRMVETQTEMDFLPPTSGPRKLGTTVEAVIFCELPPAGCLHRAVASAIDWSMVLIGYGLFLAAYRLAGGEFTFNSNNLAIMAAALPVLGFAYGLMWAVGGAETFGMNFAQLRLINFEDGLPPDRRQRLVRFAGSCLSLIPCGLGLLWALADEETLTWADHMSRCFPTPRELEARVFQRL
jgi:hypothetical protein